MFNKIPLTISASLVSCTTFKFSMSKTGWPGGELSAIADCLSHRFLLPNRNVFPRGGRHTYIYMYIAAVNQSVLSPVFGGLSGGAVAGRT